MLDAALTELHGLIPELQLRGLLNASNAADTLARIKTVANLGQALDGACHVQENAPESLAAKQALFAELDRLTPATCTLASSTSALLPSSFAEHLKRRERVLVAHPLNPPHLVPSPWTSQAAMQQVAGLMEAAGQKCIVMSRELPGFVMNRLQGALLHEAFRLVEGGYATVAGVDAAVRDGLGMRWSFMGPFETIDLNAPEGIEDFIHRYADAYRAIGAGQREMTDWSGDTCRTVVEGRRQALPVEQLKARQAWRDAELARLATYKRSLVEDNTQPTGAS